MDTNISSLREYLYSLRFYFLFVSFIFVCAIVIGYNGVLSEVFSAPLEWIEELSGGIKDFTDIYPAWLIFMVFFAVIFLNNAFTCFLDIILGPLLGVFPLFSLILNGGLIGWFAQEEGLIVFLAIAPHGMFEIPAFLLSTAIGLKLGREVLKRKEERHLKDELRNALRAYLILVLLLLFIAALIESGLIVAALFFI
ncbi:stage II sporulation protein M [Methanophagales archaeon]|nr:stage II sporulation protein M [Methanophagales archaeon]